jgi:hypothetical protein
MAQVPLPPQGPRPNPVYNTGRTQLDPGLLTRIGQGLKSLFTGAPADNVALASTGDSGNALIQNMEIGPQPGPEPGVSQVWMGPGSPIGPVAPRADVAGREFDYVPGVNIQTRPRRYEEFSFEMLEGAYNALDLVKLCVETRKDQVGNLTWSCMPRQAANEVLRSRPDARCAQIEEFFRKPDGRLAWVQWIRELVHDMLVFDAPAVYVRRDLGGSVHSLEVVKGTQIVVNLDTGGRVPEPPYAGYQQILHGVPAINYTSDELIYWPRNLRSGHRYGNSPVEQILFSINIAVRREVEKLNYFTEGNIPEALIGCPEDWGPDQIARWQAVFDATSQDQTTRRRARFVPGKMVFQPTRTADSLGSIDNEWWARVICYAFSLPPLPFVTMQNRATADSAYQSAIQEGLEPLMVWLKSFIDEIIQRAFGFTDLELVWDGVEHATPQVQEPLDNAAIQIGKRSIDEVRIKAGDQPIGMTHFIWGIGPFGGMFASDLIKARDSGAMLKGFMAIGTPPAPDQGPVGPGALPGDALSGPGILSPASPPGAAVGGMHPAAGAALQGVSPKLLTAVGIGAAGSAGRHVDVTAADEFQSDPLARAVAHPSVLALLRNVERRQGRAR